MSTYAIGDIQGCLEPLKQLLNLIEFDPAKDHLLLAGDLVARGPDSLGTLRFLHDIRDNLHIVLGNHDLHILAVRAGSAKLKPREADLLPLLDAEDGNCLLDWLQQQKLLIEVPEFRVVMTHAGIPPQWSLEKARALAAEVEKVLHGDQPKSLYANMYGNQPDYWQDDLENGDRLRLITNYFTRMRFIDKDGRLELGCKGTADNAPPGFMPWFAHPDRQITDHTLLFGHWAALNGVTHVDGIEALDTGCVWGHALTALRLDDRKRFSCPCSLIPVNPRPVERD
jgi:bis(5'-nucleosyl)-tetraphosphatase (symmetrical)